MKNVLIIALLVILAPLQTDVLAAERALDHIVAVVEEDVILRSELDRETQVASARLRSTGKPVPPTDVLEREVLETLIIDRLQTAAAARSGITVGEEEVDNAIAGIAERNNVSVSQLKQILASSGMSYNSFRETIRKQLLEISFQRQQLGGRIDVTEAEIDNYLAQNPIEAPAGKVVTQTRARHILVRTGERTSDQDARNRLGTLRGRIMGGEDFATIARANSDDTASALKGGELGWINPGDTTPEFEQQLDALQPNAISEPFKTPFGWHIVQVQERRQQNIADQARRAEAAARIRERKGKEAVELLSRRLREEAYVEIRLGREEFDD